MLITQTGLSDMKAAAKEAALQKYTLDTDTSKAFNKQGKKSVLRAARKWMRDRLADLPFAQSFYVVSTAPYLAIHISNSQITFAGTNRDGLPSNALVTHRCQSSH
jgi:hypothetical protein